MESNLNEKRCINSTVLNETLNAFGTMGGEDIMDLYLYLTEINEVLYLNEKDYAKSVKMCKYYNSSINFSDCTKLQSMQKMGINKIVSFDDFSKIKGLSIIK